MYPSTHWIWGWMGSRPAWIFWRQEKNLLLCQELNDSLVIQHTDVAMSKPQHLGSHHDKGRLRICMPHKSFAKHLICKTLLLLFLLLISMKHYDQSIPVRNIWANSGVCCSRWSSSNCRTLASITNSCTCDSSLWKSWCGSRAHNL